MIYLGNLKQINEEKTLVNFIHYKPFHEKHGLGKTREELQQEGILVDSIPELVEIDGQSASLYCNLITKELWYEYEDVPKSEEGIQQEEINTLRQELAELKQAMAILVGDEVDV